MGRNNTHVDSSLGERIRALRIEVDISQRDLSAPGVSYAYISRVEAGTRTPSLSAVVVLAERFRDEAQAKLDNLLPLQDDDSVELVEYVALLNWTVANVNALYLLTGDVHSQCLICGRHEHGGTANGSPNGNGRP